MKTRLSVIATATAKYFKPISNELSKEMLQAELCRINEIATGQEYYDYQAQKWMKETPLISRLYINKN